MKLVLQEAIGDGWSKRITGATKATSAQMLAMMKMTACTKHLVGSVSLKNAAKSLLLTFLSWFAGPTTCAAHMQNAAFITSDGLAVTQLHAASVIQVPPSAVARDLAYPEQGKVYERCFTGATQFRISASPERRKR